MVELLQVKNALLTLFVITQFAHSISYNDGFYRKLKNRHSGSCQLYNGSVCRDYLAGKIVYLPSGITISSLEKELSRWFKHNKKDGQISRECWPHSHALSCMHIYPECNYERKEPIKTSVCSSHCSFLKNHLCKGEYKRAKHSKYLQRFIPLCEEVSLIDDSNGDFCYFLPTVNLNAGPVPYAEPKKKIRFQEDQTGLLKCLFGIKNFVWTKDNAHMITEGTWYKNNNRIVGNRRIATRTKQKGKARLFMLLKMKNVNRRDAGDYRCVITFGNVTVSSSVKLTVITRGVIAEQQKPDDKCVNYDSGICKPYFKNELGNNFVLEGSHNKIELVNRQLEEFIRRLKSSNKLSKKCAEFGQAVLCYNKFKKCDNVTKEVSNSLCKRDCELFRTEYCHDELQLIGSEKTLKALYIPQCILLPENNKKCISIASETDISLIKNSVHPKFSKMHCYDVNSTSNYFGSVSMTKSGKLCDLWKNYKNFQHIPHDYCRNFGENRPWCFVHKKKEYCSIKSCDPMCFNGKGEGYYGRQSITKSGKKCLPWNKVASKYIYSNIDHSYCRNFDNDQIAPWCFIAEGVKELCNIPKCAVENLIEHSTVSLVVYIVPAVVGAAALIFSMFLLAFYMKNRKLLKLNKSKEYIVSVTDTTEKPLVNTLSTTASLDLEKEQNQKGERLSITPVPNIEVNEPRRTKKYFSVPEVKEARLRNMTKIGNGKLGQLWQGEFVENRHKSIPVIVRKLRPETRSAVVSEFRLEMNMLRGLKNRNLQRVVCVSAMSEIPFIGFECKNRLDLKEYLKGNINSSLELLTKILYQITSGLEYMHYHKVLHKDIAARNCFVSSSGNIRLSKCELGRCRYPNDYIQVPILSWAPVRWLSPETLRTGEYRSLNDIYMLGVLIWEIFSQGRIPYEEYTDENVLEQIIGVNQLLRPQGCPLHIWHIVEQCWANPMCHRPEISWIKEQFLVRTPVFSREQ